MDRPKVQVALELFKRLPLHQLRPEGVWTKMTREERLIVFETGYTAIRRAPSLPPRTNES